MEDRMQHLVTLAAAMTSGTKSDALNHKQKAQKAWLLLQALETVYMSNGEGIQESEPGIRTLHND